jgi:hypothetical protein
MKTIFLLLTLPLLVFAETPEQSDMKWVNTEIEAIKPPRKGLPANGTFGLKNPFMAQLILNRPKTEGKVKKKVVATYKKPPLRSLTLEVIINGKSVMIDGSWYKLDDKIYGYTISEIGRNTVTLESKKRTKTLSLVKKNKHIEINAK